MDSEESKKKSLSFNEIIKKERNRFEILERSSSLSEVLKSAIKANDLSLSTSTLKEFEDRGVKLQRINDSSSFVNLKKAMKQIDSENTVTASIARSINLSTSAAIAKSINTSAFASIVRSMNLSTSNSIAESMNSSTSAALAKSIKTTSAFASIADSMNTSVFASIAKSMNTAKFQSEAKLYEPFFNSITPISKIYSSELVKLESDIARLGLKNIVHSEAFIKAKSIEAELIRFEPSVSILPITTLEKSIQSEDPEPFLKARQEIKIIESIEQIQVTKADIPLQTDNPAKDKRIDILIITGLPLELNIFCDVFNVQSRWQSEKFNAQYYFGSVKSKNKVYSVALCCGIGMGNFNAALITNAAVEDLNPKIVISAGIGYTLNPCKLQLCDLHITNMIVHWGLTSKEYEGSGRKVRTSPVQVKSSHLFQEVRDYEAGLKKGSTSFAQWKKNSKCSEPKYSKPKVNKVLKEINFAVKCGKPKSIFNESPNIEIGSTMVSDDAVIASLEEITKRSLVHAGNEAQISGEMEAAGIALALAIRKAPIEFIAIRGISDFGFGKEALETSSGEFRLIAATRAATFIESLIKSDLTLPKSDSGVTCELGTKLIES